MVSNLVLVVLNWIHIVAVVAWGGGAIFLTFVLTPSLSKRPPKEAAPIGQDVSKRFLMVGWTSIVVIALTGLLRMYFTKTLSLGFLIGSSYGQILLVKIVIFLVMILLVTMIMSTGLKLAEAKGPEAVIPLQRRLELLSKTTISLGIIAIFLAVGLRHGGF